MKICFVASSNPEFLGGVSLYLNNVISNLKNDEVVWIYRNTEYKIRKKNNIKYIGVKVPQIYLWNEIVFNIKTLNFLRKNYFERINSHAISGFWLNFYKKKKNQKIIHTYHGSTYYFYKNHFKRFNLMKKILFLPLLLFSHFIEKPPMKKADKVICVSKHVKNELEGLYGKRENIEIIKTGVDLKIFKPRDKIKSREKLNLEKNKTYGLYIGRGGFWTKGLDKVINLSKKIYKLDENYRLLVIGADKNKVRHLINEKFIILFPPLSRGKMPDIYNSANIFFSMSRYEGGAPNMVTSEAMASGCLIVTDKDANQEIIKNEKNGLIIKEEYSKEAKRILGFVRDTKKLDIIIKNSLETVKDLSLEKWKRGYLKVLKD